MHTAGTAFRSRIPSIKKRFITELRSLCCISGSIYLPPTRLFVSFRFDLSIVNVWRRNSTHHNQNFSALLFNCRLRLMWQQYFFFQSLATVIFDFWPEIQYAMVTSKKRGSNSTAVQMTYKTGNLCHAIISFSFIHSFVISVPLSHIIHSDIRGRQSNMRPSVWFVPSRWATWLTGHSSVRKEAPISYVYPPTLPSWQVPTGSFNNQLGRTGSGPVRNRQKIWGLICHWI